MLNVEGLRGLDMLAMSLFEWTLIGAESKVRTVKYVFCNSLSLTELQKEI